MIKPTERAMNAFESAFPDDPRVVRKKMFGMPAGFVNGNMFMGVFADGVTLRLPEDQRNALAAREGMAPFEPMEGRPWKEYLHASSEHHGGTEALADWARLALDHTSEMPAKQPKSRKKS